MNGAYDYPSEASSAAKGVPKYWWIYNRYPNDITYGRR
jgi:hypothetical protein